MKNILLLEDCVETQTLIEGLLSSQFRVLKAESLFAAREIVSRESIDFALIDVALPDGDGFGFCETLNHHRVDTEIPFMFITGHTDQKAKVKAFQMGADDYIVKPFDPIELRARVVSKMKKIEKKKSDLFVSMGDFVFDLTQMKVLVKENSESTDLNLTRIEFKLLYQLSQSLGQPLSREVLLEKVWGGKIHVLDRTVDAHVYSLRKKLGKRSDQIRAVSGQGYQLN